jgi:hypothetical protein
MSFDELYSWGRLPSLFGEERTTTLPGSTARNLPYSHSLLFRKEQQIGSVPDPFLLAHSQCLDPLVSLQATPGRIPKFV